MVLLEAIERLGGMTRTIATEDCTNPSRALRQFKLGPGCNGWLRTEFFGQFTSLPKQGERLIASRCVEVSAHERLAASAQGSDEGQRSIRIFRQTVAPRPHGIDGMVGGLDGGFVASQFGKDDCPGAVYFRLAMERLIQVQNAS